MESGVDHSSFYDREAYRRDYAGGSALQRGVNDTCEDGDDDGDGD